MKQVLGGSSAAFSWVYGRQVLAGEMQVRSVEGCRSGT